MELRRRTNSFVTVLLIPTVLCEVTLTLEEVMKATGGMNNCTLPLTSFGADVKRHVPAALLPQETCYPLCRRLGWSSWPVWAGV